MTDSNRKPKREVDMAQLRKATRKILAYHVPPVEDTQYPPPPSNEKQAPLNSARTSQLEFREEKRKYARDVKRATKT